MILTCTHSFKIKHNYKVYEWLSLTKLIIITNTPKLVVCETFIDFIIYIKNDN